MGILLFVLVEIGTEFPKSQWKTSQSTTLGNTFTKTAFQLKLNREDF